METMSDRRIYVGDRVSRGVGSAIPLGAEVRVVRGFARRRVLVEYGGKTWLTMLWCLRPVREETR